MVQVVLTLLVIACPCVMQVLDKGEVCSRLAGCEACLMAGCYFVSDRGCVSDMSNGNV